MKDILFVTHFIRGTLEGRFEYLTQKLFEEGNDVELITSNFSHTSKERRKTSNFELFPFKVTLLKEPSYGKNVSLKRFYSHIVLANSLKKYLKGRKKPDVIYCSVPSLDVAFVAARYAKENQIKFIIDIQDLWPEAFKMVFNKPFLGSLIFYPMKQKADYIYRAADEIIAVSETYTKRALDVNKKVNVAHSVFLGTELSNFDKKAKANLVEKKVENEFLLAYIGTLGHSYDLKTIIDAMKIIKEKRINKMKFIVMGDGPLKSHFKKYAEEMEVDVEFTGSLSYEKMVGKLCSCDIAINPISKGAAQSIINKHGDYAAAGLPVISTQENPEYQNLVTEYKMGINCINSDPSDVAKNILILYKNEELKISMGKNSRKLAEQKFDRERTYKEIINVIVK